MKIADHIDDIKNLPIENQAFRSRRATWENKLINVEVPKLVTDAFNSLFPDNREEISISRGDLREYAKNLNDDPGRAKLIIATIMWGYPRGMRDDHFPNIVREFQLILDSTRNNVIRDWVSHWERIKKINGMGLSTYSKILCFSSIHVMGDSELKSLMLDQIIIRVIASRKLDELEQLNEPRPLAYNSAPLRYVNYLSCLDSLSKDYKVPAENIELFLFQYGKNLKPIAG